MQVSLLTLKYSLLLHSYCGFDHIKRLSSLNKFVAYWILALDKLKFSYVQGDRVGLDCGSWIKGRQP